MAGTIPLSMTQQFDEYGAPLAGGKLYIIEAGTVSTPQDAFVDTGLATAHPYPMTLDAAGRVPQFFLDDSASNQVKIRLQNAAGVVQLSADSVLIIGPSISGGGGGGGSTVDSTQLIQTGMMMFSHTTGSIAGFVRLNGRTVGSVSSGATERPNADCQALFLFLWPDTTLSVSGGRGVNAAADWAANKTLALPDWRGYALGALDDMGNTAAGRLTATYFGVAATVLGAVGGSENTTLSTAQLPAHAHTGLTGTPSADHSHKVHAPISRVTAAPIGGGPAGFWTGTGTDEDSGGTSTTHIHGFTTDNSGGGSPHRTIGPRKLVTFYMKL